MPELFWGFYGHRMNLYRNTKPHYGYEALLDIVTKSDKIKDYFVITSNVDGMFEKSGFDTEKIWEIHGNIHYFQNEDGEVFSNNGKIYR